MSDKDDERTSKPITLRPSRTGWKLFRHSKKYNTAVNDLNVKRNNKKTKRSSGSSSHAEEHLIQNALTTRLLRKDTDSIQRKRSTSTGSLDSEDSAEDPKVKSTRLTEYLQQKDKSFKDLITDFKVLVQPNENDEDSMDGKAIPLKVFREKSEKRLVQLPGNSDELSDTSEQRERSVGSLTSFSLYSSISSVPSDAKKQLDDDSVVRHIVLRDYKVPFQVSTEKPKHHGNIMSSISVSTPSSPNTTAVTNIESDTDADFADDFLQSMLDEVAKDMEELQTLFSKNKSHSHLDAVISSNQSQNDMNTDLASLCSTASFDADDFAEDDFVDHSPFEAKDQFVITTIVEEDEDGSSDDPVEAALKRGRLISAQAEIESFKSTESDLTSASENESKTSLSGSLISFVPDYNDFFLPGSSTSQRQLSKSISWKIGKPLVHLFQPDTTKSSDINFNISGSASSSKKSTNQISTCLSKQPVSILRSNSGRQLSESTEVNPKSSSKNSRRNLYSSDVSTNGSVISSASSETSDSVCYMLERLRNETERRRNRVRIRRGISQ